MRKKIIPLLFVFGGLGMGALAYYLLYSRYGSPTAQAAASIWTGIGMIYALAFWLSQGKHIRHLMIGSAIKLMLVPGLILVVGLIFTPAMAPTVVSAVIAIVIMQGLYIAFSL